MESRGSARDRLTRIMCVNCGICVNTLRRCPALALDTRVSAVLCSWIYPQIITEADCVCEACRDLAIFSVNENLHQASGNNEEQAGSRPRGHTEVCILCGCSILRRQSDKILRENTTDLQQSMINIIQSRVIPQQINESDRVCHACWLRTQREARRMNILDNARTPVEPVASLESHVPIHDGLQPSEDVETSHSISGSNHSETNMASLVLPNYRRAANSNNHCVFPNCNSTTLHSITDKLRAIVLSNHNYYLPSLARVCSPHLASISWEILYHHQNNMTRFTVDQIQHIFSFVNAFNPTLDFENLQDIDDSVFEYWIGQTKLQFNSLLEEVPGILEIRRGPLGLAALLLKMGTGDSDERIFSLVKVPRRTLENLMDKVRHVLLQNFVPRNLGINHIPREDILNHNLYIPNGLYGNGHNAIVICDGTYIYIHKSSNYMFQKQSYSTHKYRNLLKPFLIVATDGYIIDCLGPYKAITSDAEIMSVLFREGSALQSYFTNGDVFILDRGFRDSISMLEGYGFRTCMPESLLEGEHQLTTAQANRSRCVTICRWVVEAVNGHFKRDFKLFRQNYFHRSLPHMMENFKIAAALLNRFGVRFQDNMYATEILQIINENINLENNLANAVLELNMNRRRSIFRNINADRNNVNFPTLEYRDLILFALGTYQIKQARSYYGEHVRSQGGYRIEVCSEPMNIFDFHLRSGDTLIRGKIKSRHVSMRQYYVYIVIQNNVPGRTGITAYCCSCLVGRRTVGCCAHVMTLVWYLGWARHQEDAILAPAEFLDSIVIDEE